MLDEVLEDDVGELHLDLDVEEDEYEELEVPVVVDDEEHTVLRDIELEYTDELGLNECL